MTGTYNRRTVLAAIGSAGALTLGSSFLTSRRPSYTKYTYAQTGDDGLRLSVSWYEICNGEFQEATNGSTEQNVTTVTDPAQAPFYVPEAPGPIITLGNVLPGDSGAVVIGLLAEEVPSETAGMDVWFRPDLTSNLENGVNEPELKAWAEDDTGDGTSDGELADSLIVQFFQDNGLFGGCDGQNGILEQSLTEKTSLSAAFTAIEDGVDLTDPCLEEGERRCIGFTWELPGDVGNAVQSDSVAFDFQFEGVECGKSPSWRDSNE